MPQLPTVRGVAKQAETGARRAVETWRHPTERRRRLPARPPRIGLLSRLGDRIANREFLRLRGRFRGRRGLIAFLAVMGPGLIAGVAGNDAGGITTYSVMGAQTGLTLLWIFPITIIILAVVQEIAARLGVVTGQGLSDLIRDRFGVRWTAFAMLVLLVANLANTVAEFSGAAAALEIFGISRYITVPLVAVLIWALVLFSSYRTVERVFLAIALVFVTYIFSAVPGPSRLGPGRRHALVSPNLNGLTGRRPAADRGGRRHDDHAVHAVLPAERRRRERDRRGRARPGAGRLGRRRGLDQRDRRVHRDRDRAHDPCRRAARSTRPATPPWPSSRWPATWPRCSSRSACSGPASWRRRSCRSRPRS